MRLLFTLFSNECIINKNVFINVFKLSLLVLGGLYILPIVMFFDRLPSFI